MLRFGEFALDTVGARLLRAGVPVELQPKVYELLVLLLSEPGRLFSREEIEAVLWHDVVVTEHSLSQAVRRLRVALGEETKHPRFIETVPKRGYRWMGALVSDQGATQLRRSLPRPEDAFFGRQSELEQLRSALAQSRLVSIVGPGGIGKTRLALALPEVTIGCRLGSVTDEPSLYAAMADGLSLPPEAATARGIRAALSGCSELILLDEAEVALERVARAVTDWLGCAPAVRFLVTSRSRLGLSAERCLELGPLSVDEGVALYVARTAAVEPAACDAEEEVRALVEALDGWPLAIELAAARRSLLDAASVRSRMLSSLTVLSGSRLDKPERHGSLAQALEWSWSLLSGPERVAAARLSIFAGSMALESAEHVLSDLSEPLELLEALRHRCWLQRSGERFAQYTPLRLFAAAQRDAMGLREVATARFVEAMAARANALENEPTARLAEERANLWAAFEATSDPLRALELHRALVRLDAHAHGSWARVFQASERAVALAEGTPPLQSRALSQHSRLKCRHDRSGAVEDAQQALLLAGDEPQLRINALRSLAQALPEGDPAQFEALTEAVDLARASGDRRGLAGALDQLGRLLGQRGRELESFEVLTAAAEEWRCLGIGWAEARSLLYLSKAALPNQDLVLAQRLTLQALDLVDPRHDAALYAEALNRLAVLAWYESRSDDMRALLHQIETLQRTTWLWNPGLVSRYRAELAAEEGDLAQARAHLASIPPAATLLGRAEQAFSELMVLVAEGRWEEAEHNTTWREAAYRECGYSVGEAGTQTWHALVTAAKRDLPATRRWSDMALGLMDESFGSIGQQYALLAEAAPVAATAAADPSARPVLQRMLGALVDLAPLGPSTGKPALAPDVRVAVRLLEGLSGLTR